MGERSRGRVVDDRLIKGESAAVYDVTVANFDREIRPLVRPQHVRKEVWALDFYARGVLDGWYGAMLT